MLAPATDPRARGIVNMIGDAAGTPGERGRVLKLGRRERAFAGRAGLGYLGMG